MTVMDYQCPECKNIWEVSRGMKDNSPIYCPSCHNPGIAYFGKMNANEIAINYGFRPHRYSNPTDHDIAKFQFKNL